MTIKNSELINSQSFCVLPFIHLATTPQGEVKPCCINTKLIKDTNGNPANLSNQDIDDIWNSVDMAEIRKTMLKGSLPESCRQCHQEELLGNSSYRINNNQEWLGKFPATIENNITQSQKNEGLLKASPSYFDLRLGNTCNLQCRSCGPDSSSSLLSEFQQISKEQPEIENFFSLNIQNTKWQDSDYFLQNLRKNKRSIKKLYLTGGEPTIVPNVKKLLNDLVDEGLSKNISIMLNTNITQVQDSFYELLQNFQQVQVNISVDAVGAQNNYLRYPSKWEEIIQNFNRLVKYQEFNFVINPVIQIPNLISVIDLFELLLNRKDKNLFIISPIITNSHSFLDIKTAPNPLRKIAIAKYNRFLRTYRNADKALSQRLEQLINLLKEPASPESHVENQRLLDYYQLLDKNRFQSFSEVFPIIHKYLSNKSITETHSRASHIETTTQYFTN